MSSGDFKTRFTVIAMYKLVFFRLLILRQLTKTTKNNGMLVVLGSPKNFVLIKPQGLNYSTNILMFLKMVPLDFLEIVVNNLYPQPYTL